ncbi:MULTISPECIES: chromosomal replication initiator protein DnaA [Herbaspirillum]|jgi:chromosomal replication initiator protein|uniref:Chromosomal replication initiator protein DnaA n=1 Tax=Herbaspirillum aquaticum TaxID=568783 RepID=A0A225SNM9_9BURK|nr:MULTISPECIES: chromosomal replication initiator protein DnaA [Herbaspirillum]MBW9335773.1 chromosomal replication initiator protein DnaA [Herbaspirillum sp. RU 5E]EIJ44751.1 chromosomal replication initiator protein [Herbaspirillum sp. GW103]MCI1006847.1 chromosomal replication initiator protein DnaA [Herbaspirillum sp. C7C8]MRT31478.1 chromosomal replication initiator protein DnaA [Herbaspirillum sp. CAH-3]NUT62720.1 chromosomal replication initiator protein DnaA [Herbaspirillum sp. C9C3]
MENFWQACSHKLEQELTPQQYSAWIKPLVPLDFEDGLLRIAAPNRFKLDWVKTQFANRITALACEYWDAPTEVQFVLDPRGNQGRRPAANAQANGGGASGLGLPNHEQLHLDPEPAQPVRAVAPRQEQSRINPVLTFDNLVTGKANQLARAAATQVANNPGTSYNPLFLYGGVGLGKTHIIHAIGNQVLVDNPGAKIRYIHAEQYVRDVVTAYQRKGFDDFKRYYHSLDLLLIDDIQFFGGKSRTQEEFFYAFEALIAAKKQIIITSDTYPKEISGMDDRLISRFDSGLTVAIEPPELEMRVAILMKKASAEDVVLSDDVAFFVAKHLRSNVRELEGALRKILAYSRFHGKDITIDVVKEALKDLLSVQNRQISVENIQKTVADFFNIKVADMYSKKRPANIARPRQIAMYLAKELTQKSLPEIGDLFGGRDHTTVLHAVRKIAADRAKSPECNHELHVLEQTLKG